MSNPVCQWEINAGAAFLCCAPGYYKQADGKILCKAHGERLLQQSDTKLALVQNDPEVIKRVELTIQCCHCQPPPQSFFAGDPRALGSLGDTKPDRAALEAAGWGTPMWRGREDWMCPDCFAVYQACLPTTTWAPLEARRYVPPPPPVVRPDPIVVCAACRRADGTIVASPRHYDDICRALMAQLGGRKAWLSCEQGFLDQFGNFLTREEALAIATKNKQIRRRCGGDDIKLYSENLY